MCTISIKEFNSNPTKYFGIACSEKVIIVDGSKIYNLEMTMDEAEYITGEELKKNIGSHINQIYKSREQVITDEDLKNSYSPEEFKAIMKKEIHEIFSTK